MEGRRRRSYAATSTGMKTYRRFWKWRRSSTTLLNRGPAEASVVGNNVRAVATELFAKAGERLYRNDDRRQSGLRTEAR